MIDALCDMAIVAINAGYKLTTDWISGIGEVANEVKFLAYDENVKVGVIYLCESLRYFNYNPYKCLLETIKELETRTGKWCEKRGSGLKIWGLIALRKHKAKSMQWRMELLRFCGRCLKKKPTHTISLKLILEQRYKK